MIMMTIRFINVLYQPDGGAKRLHCVDLFRVILKLHALAFIPAFAVYVLPLLEYNKKYVLWNAGICPIASKVGHVTLVSSLKKI